jgi:hypothetical protein
VVLADFRKTLRTTTLTVADRYSLKWQGQRTLIDTDVVAFTNGIPNLLDAFFAQLAVSVQKRESGPIHCNMVSIRSNLDRLDGAE